MVEKKSSTTAKASNDSEGVSIVDARCEHMKNMSQQQGLDNSSRAHLEHYAHLYTKSKKKWQRRLAMVEAIDQFIISDRRAYLQQLENERKSFKKKLKTLDASLQAKTDKKVKAKKNEYEKLKRVMSKSERRVFIEEYRIKLQDENAKQHKVMVYRFYHGTMLDELMYLTRQRMVVVARSVAVKELDALTITEQHDIQRQELDTNLEYILRKEVKAVTKKAKKKPKLERELAIATAVEKANEAHEMITKDVVGVMEKRQRREVTGMANIYVKVASLLDAFYKKQNRSLEKLITKAELRLESLGAKLSAEVEESNKTAPTDVARSATSAPAAAITADKAPAKPKAAEDLQKDPDNDSGINSGDGASLHTETPAVGVKVVAISASGEVPDEHVYDTLTSIAPIPNRTPGIYPDVVNGSSDDDEKDKAAVTLATGDGGVYTHADARRLAHAHSYADGTSGLSQEQEAARMAALARFTANTMYPDASPTTDNNPRPANRLYPNMSAPTGYTNQLRTFQPTLHTSTELRFQPSAPALDDAAYHGIYGDAYNPYLDSTANAAVLNQYIGLFATEHGHSTHLHQPASAPDLYASQPLAPPAYHVLGDGTGPAMDNGTSSSGGGTDTGATTGRLDTYDELRLVQKAMYARHPQSVLAPSPTTHRVQPSQAQTQAIVETPADAPDSTDVESKSDVPTPTTPSAVAVEGTDAVATGTAQEETETPNRPAGAGKKTPPRIPQRTKVKPSTSTSTVGSMSPCVNTGKDADVAATDPDRTGTDADRTGTIADRTGTDTDRTGTNPDTGPRVPARKHVRASSDVQAPRPNKPTPPSRKHSRTSSHSLVATLRATGSYGNGDGARSPHSPQAKIVDSLPSPSTLTPSRKHSGSKTGAPDVPPRLSPNTTSYLYPAVPETVPKEQSVNVVCTVYPSAQ